MDLHINLNKNVEDCFLTADELGKAFAEMADAAIAAAWTVGGIVPGPTPSIIEGGEVIIPYREQLNEGRDCRTCGAPVKFSDCDYCGTYQ